MKRIVIAVMFTVAILGLVACSSGDSEVVVKTNVGDISKEEFYDALKDRVGEQVLQEIVTIKILEDKYTVDDKDVDEEVDTAKEQLGEQFDMWLTSQGYQDEDAFRELVRVNLLFDEAVYGEVEVSEEEIQEYYDRLSEEVEAEHILVEDEELANEIKDKLDDGEDFAELAKEYSTDPGSAEEGGKLGVVPIGEFVPEFEDAVYTLDVDAISDPVQSDHGYHIIKVTDKRDVSEEVGSLEDNETTIISTLRQQKIDPTEAQAKIQ
ncbi:MAG TPA: peptidylprolyl isomerase, partial [Atopostipes sp.]|nr:peptidylprolyl isomerase [Atopostipes sp.]